MIELIELHDRQMRTARAWVGVAALTWILMAIVVVAALTGCGIAEAI